ncbi:MAG: AMP-binding protein [Deltaproteobacteria bacterium]|nr:AMP-binding protein [Candidatus Anaeroferrophillus wilburensis]MBN2890067.1 AMP-binding protein [Deltaproteobacteria bacterium]
MLITEILARNARMYPAETALIERDPVQQTRREITWSEFDRQANQVANLLQGMGIGKGSKVIHLLMNSLEWLPLYFGILRSGAWVVPLNFRFTADDIKYCIEVAEGDVLFFGPEFAERIEQIKDELPTVKKFVYVGGEGPAYADIYEQLLAGESAEPLDVPLELNDEAALYFTSGTTGRPKPILLTQRNLEASCITENRHHLQTHEDNFILIPPLYHTGAKMHWFGNFIVGAKAVILKGVSPQWILEAVSQEQGTIVWLLVPWAQDILTAIEDGQVNLDDYNLGQWRLMHIGAQPVPPSLIREWLKVFPHHSYDTNYGLSESTGPGCVHLGMENLHKVGAIGVPGFDWEYSIVDSHGRRVTPGDPGELVVRGPSVMKEYYKNPEETARALRNGWLHTGDIARVDEDGFIYLVDRKKDVIITGGENIFPVEIEDFLQDHPDVQDAAVIGLPDERLGESVAAIIEVKPGRVLTVEQMQEFCDKLPRYKQPRTFFFDDVPRNPTGKIEKPKLREKYTGNREMFTLEGK